jgi:hypothetical protein
MADVTPVEPIADAVHLSTRAVLPSSELELVPALRRFAPPAGELRQSSWGMPGRPARFQNPPAFRFPMNLGTSRADR